MTEVSQEFHAERMDRAEEGAIECSLHFLSQIFLEQSLPRALLHFVRRTDITFHSENAGALHFREIGKDVGMRCKIDNGQLWRDVFNRERNNAYAHFVGAELAHG